MKRIVWTSVAALAIATAATIPLTAQLPQGRGRGPGAGMGMGPGGGPGPGGPLPILRALNLTDAQREQVRAIMAERKDTAPPGAKIGELQRKLEAAILADTPDHAAIDELKSAIVAAHNEELAARIDVETRIAQILTPEQRAQARDILSKEPAPGFRGRRGGGFWH